MRAAAFLLVAVTLADSRATAQTTEAPAAETAATLSASVSTYFVPDGESFVMATMARDRGWLHLEARFNYEDRDTGSAWIGYNFSVGTRVAWEITPMVGAVFGNTGGVAPGYLTSLRWRKLDVSSEAEYVIDTSDSAGSFFYTWSELGLTPRDWYRFGLVVQRTKAVEEALTIQRGLFAGFTYKRASVTAYFFNPDTDQPSAVIGVGLDF